MSTLLVQSCSKTKQQVKGKVPALELYTGYFYRIINKARREDAIRSDVDIIILSAEHGLIDADEKIAYYDRQMNSSRAAELQESIVSSLQELITDKDYTQVIINMGIEYRKAIEGFDDDLSVNVHEIKGEGIGHKGRALKEFLRTDKTGVGVVQ